MNPSIVITTMRQLYRQQVKMSYMNQKAIDFIQQEGLMKEHSWPASHIIYTEAGVEYMQENSGTPEVDGG